MYPVSGGIAVTTPNSSFNWDYYKNTHMPLVAEVFRDRLMGYIVVVPKNNVDDQEKYHCI